GADAVARGAAGFGGFTRRFWLFRILAAARGARLGGFARAAGLALLGRGGLAGAGATSRSGRSARSLFGIWGFTGLRRGGRRFEVWIGVGRDVRRRATARTAAPATGSTGTIGHAWGCRTTKRVVAEVFPRGPAVFAERSVLTFTVRIPAHLAGEHRAIRRDGGYVWERGRPGGQRASP